MEEANQAYIASKLKGIIEPMVAQTVLQRPENVPEFMLEWLKKMYNRSDPSNDDAGSEVESLTDEEDNEEPAPLPVITKKVSMSRKAVSAEAYGEWNKKEDFKPRVIPKTEEQKERIREKLKMSFVFNALDARELEIVVNAMEEKKLAKDDCIIKQGDDGDNLYVVDSGTLACSRKFAPDQEPKFLKNYQPGEAFGELALLYNAPRAATIVANEESILWALDRPTFSNIVKDAAIKKREKYEEFLKSVKVFSTIEPYELTKVMDAVKPIEFQAGDTIIKEGDKGDVFFLLESGEAYATKTIEPGKDPIKVMEYKKGDYFGELALIKNTPRAANVIARTNCVCLTLDRHSFKRLLGPLDDILKRNMDVYQQYAAKIN